MTGSSAHYASFLAEVAENVKFCETEEMTDLSARTALSDMMRTANIHRVTKESDIFVEVDLANSGVTEISTGLPFFDHMLTQLGKHGGFNLTVRATGDLEVDAHHTVEDTGIVIGETFKKALGDKAGIRRFASLSIPLDEALIDVAIDLSGRPFIRYEVPFAPDTPKLGDPGFDPQLAEEFFRALAMSAGMTLHLSLRYGKNSHHIIEASFKAFARALCEAIQTEGDQIPSTKGIL
jgi:imidazoleglycerol-phosphate dehydratase